MIAGGAVLTAGLAALVSAIVPGRTLAARPHAGSPATAHTAPVRTASGKRMPPLASASALGLQGPGQAPQASTPTPATSAPPQASPPAAPAPAPSSGGGAVVSGGS